MERSTLYRAISAPTALVGALCSLLVAGWMLSRTGFLGAAEPVPLTTRDFIFPWLIALIVTASANTFFLWREARRDQRAFFSAQLRVAIRSLLPAVLVAAAITWISWRNPFDPETPVILALSWIAGYGLALLATMNFAPRSLSVLGWTFVITAVIWLLIMSAPTLPTIEALHGQTGGNVAMGITFGFYHLIYAIATWRRAAGGKAQAIE